MLPFNDPNFLLQQGMLYNPNINGQIAPFPNVNAPFPNMNGGNLNNFQGPNPNIQPMAQNNQLGVIQMLAAHIQSNPQLQMSLLNQLQSQNLGAPFQQAGMPFLGHNPNQMMMGMPNGQFHAQNQMFQGNQMMGFSGNPHLGQNNMSLGFGKAPGILGQNPTDASPAAVMNAKRPQTSASPIKNQWHKKNMQHDSGSRQFQVNHVEKTGVSSHNSAGEGSGRNFGSQKSQSIDMRSSMRNQKQFNRRGGKGQHNRREQQPYSMTSGEEASTVRRLPPINYPKAEIQVWREARKKNFPTRANLDKKSNGGENTGDADAKLRRQQLKEVLAKQAELGVEVAEVPPTYLLEPEELVLKKENEQKVIDGESGNRFNKKRWRGHAHDNWHSRRGNDQDGWHSKRQKFKKKEAPASLSSVKREPSLLQKLLSADIKRDKNRLLQVFRFMVKNDFFKQWPGKPLEFPTVTVKGDGLCGDALVADIDPCLGTDSPRDEDGERIAVEKFGNPKESCVGEELEYESGEDDNIDNDKVPNCTKEGEDQSREQSKLEEGEITDQLGKYSVHFSLM